MGRSFPERKQRSKELKVKCKRIVSFPKLEITGQNLQVYSSASNFVLALSGAAFRFSTELITRHTRLGTGHRAVFHLSDRWHSRFVGGCHLRAGLEHVTAIGETYSPSFILAYRNRTRLPVPVSAHDRRIDRETPS